MHYKKKKKYSLSIIFIYRTLVSIIMFPILQYNFSRDVYDPTYKEIMPELVYGVGKVTI